MNSIVIYASRYGNTRKIAEAIADALRQRGTAQIFAADDAPTRLPEGADLIVVGGPTEVHGMTKPLAEALRRIEPETLHSVAAAAFDTRLHGQRWLTGSAGVGAWNKLHHAGARMLTPAESFFVKNKEGAAQDEGPELELGELERATQWATVIAEKAQVELASTQR